MNILNKNAIATTTIILLYVYIILFRLINHFPWFDEAHAWIIAQEVPLSKLLSVIRVEGHPFLWFTILMPFAKAGILYPFSMYFLNTGFCFASLFLLWKKSEFLPLTKYLIMFSYPFIGLYPIIARNYSLGIFILFLLTAYYDEKFKRPILYSFMILLCMNSSVMAFFGASSFAILFLIEYIRSKQYLNKYSLLSIINIIIGFALIFIQFFDKKYLTNIQFISSSNLINDLFIQNAFFINVFLLIIFTILTLFYLLKNNEYISLFFISFTYIGLLTICTFVYPFGIWHIYFFYIYFIISLWLTRNNSYKFKNILTCIISFILIFNYPSDTVLKRLYGNEGKLILNTVLEDDNLRNAKLIHNNGTVYSILPLAKKYNINLVNYCNNNNINYDLSVITLGNKLCKHDDGISEAQEHLSTFINQVNNNTIMITTDRYEANKYFLTDSKNKLYIEKYKCVHGYCYWKMITE